MVDALCLYDLDAYGRELNSPLDELYQDLVHRLQEAYGSNLDDPDRGVGLPQMLSKGFDLKDASGPAKVVGHSIEVDFRKDPRISQVQASAILNSDGTISVTIRVVADAGQLGIDLLWAGGTLITKPQPPYPS